jgi:hypothetical protein
MRYVYQVAAALVALSFPLSFEAHGQGVQGLSITNYQFVSEQRWSRTQSYVTYRADLVNTGPARDAVTATVSSSSPAVQIVPGQTNLHFSPVPANSQVTSSNTFTILVDRTVPFDFKTLQWSFLAPYANAGPNQTVGIGATVTVNGSASTNPSGVGNLSYKWAFVSRPPGTATKLFGSDAVIAQFTVDVPGNYVLSLTVSNGVGSDTAIVTVSTTNSPPVANAGPNQTVGLGATVTLNGGNSSDVDGDPLTYSWTLISKPAGSAATLSGANTISPTFVADKAGSYVVQLIVNDGKVDSKASTVQITTGNTPPVANAGANQIVNVGSVVTLNGSGSTDVDGDALTYHWSFNSRPAGSAAALNNATAVNPTFTADAPGTYVVQLIVNDGKADSNPATVTITTNALQPPIANAGQDQTVQHGATVSLTGSATDPQGLPLTFHWSFTTKPSGSAAVLSSTTIARPTFVADLPGTYVVQLIVNNGFLNSAPSNVTIATTNVAPVANAGSDQTVQVGATVALDGSASSDADHDPLSFSWSLLSRPGGSSAALSAANSPSPTFVADVAGTYVVQLIVNDGFVNSDPKTVTITAGLKSITLTPNPLNLATNSSSALTVKLGSAAGPGGVDVKLISSDTTIVTVPASVTIPENSTSATVNVTSTATAGSAFILATATGFSNGSATINTSPAGITVALDSNTIGVTTTVNGTITLSSPAPSGGVVVSLTATPSGIVTVPASITIASGSTGTFTVTGVATGAATITANAPGYTSGSANVTVAKLGAIKLQSNITVGPNQSVPFPVTLVSGAPVGGVTITLSSSDPSIASIPSSVFIPQGQTAPSSQPQVTGLKFGSVTITASAPGFDGDSQTVQVTATLSFSPKTLTVGAGGTGTLTLNLSAPAPAGLTIALSSDNTSAATVPASVAFPANATSVSVTVTAVSAGSATIHASSLPNLADTTATISVALLGDIILPANISVNLGQSVPLPVTLSAAAPAGGTTVTLTSSDPSKLTILPSTVTIGTGKTTPDTPPQITGVGVGTVTITASAPAFTSATQAAAVTASLSFSPQNITVQAGGTQNVTLSLPAPTPAAITLTLTSDNTGVASVPPSITIPANAVGATVLVTGVGPGTTKIHATGQNLQADANVTVESPGPIGIPSNLIVPLGQTAQFAVTLPKAAQSTVTVTLSSSDSSRVTISPATVTIAAGQTTPATQPQVTGAGVGTANITASATGYTTATQAVQVSAAVNFSPQNVTILGFTTQNVTLNLSAVTAAPVVINLSSSNTAVATVPASVTIPANSSSATVTITGVAVGSAVIHASASPNIPDATANVSVAVATPINVPASTSTPLGQSVQFAISLASPAISPVTVNLSSSDSSIVSVSPSSVTIAAGATTPAIQPQVTGSSVGSANITASATGYSSGTGAVNVTASLVFSPQDVSVGAGGSQVVTLSLPAKTVNPLNVTLASDDTTVATVPASVTIAANTQTVNVTVNGVTAGSTAIHATAANVTAANAAVTVQSDIILSPLSIQLGQQGALQLSLARPAGPDGVLIQLTSSDTSKVTVRPSVVTIQAGRTQPANPPLVTGLDFGTATITAATFGLTSASATVTVGATLSFTSDAITLTPSSTQSAGLFLSVPATSPVIITLSSSDSTIATVPASITIPAGQQGVSFQVTGAAVGQAIITASTNVPTIPNATMKVTVGAPGTILLPSNVSENIGQTVPFAVSLSSPAGPNGVTVTLNATDGISFVPLTCTGTPCPPVPPGATQTTVFIPAGQTTIPAASQPQMRGVSPGPVTITATAPGYDIATTQVQVTASFTFSPQSLTINPQANGFLLLTLSGPAPPPPTGLTVTLTSSNPSVATVPASFTFFWDGSIPTSLNIPVWGIAPGTAVITAKSPNMADATATVTVSGPLTITTASLPDGTVGAAYNATVNASGGATPYTWSATGLPAGLSMNASTGQINGTPTATGVSTVNITVTDSTSPSHQTASASLSLLVKPSGSLSITTTSPLPGGVVGTAYNATVAATGGTTPYTWSATGLPAGLTINASSGAITGTPTTAGASTVAVTVTDSTNPTHLTATASLSITIIAPPSITTTSLPGGVVGAAYNATVAATGGTTPYTWSATGLPAGLSIDAASGAITGTPTTAGSSTVTITVTDSTNPAHLSAAKTLSINIAGQLAITTTSLPSGVVNTAYAGVTLAATGGAPPYTWSATGLPAGLTLNASTGQIAGTPTAATTNTVTITVTDSSSPAHLTASKSLSITIAGQLTITTSSLPSGVVNTAYPGATLAATGGVSPYTWSATGLPAGLTLNASTGQISGTPTAAGASTVAITVTDSSSPSHLTATANLTLTVIAPLNITTSSLPGGVAGAAYNATVNASGGTTPYTWSATGLPAGLSIDPSTGAITGTPTAAGASTVSITVTDSTNPTHLTATKSLSITVVTPVAITTTSLPGGVTGAAYNATVAATGGTTPYTWSATGLPAGLSINASSGAISGSPTAAGTSTVSITVTDSTSPTHLSATKNLLLTIAAQLTITTASPLPGGSVDAPYSTTIAATGGTTPYTWSATGLPAGLSIDPSTGAISGTPTTAGAVTVAVTVSDSASSKQTATKNFSLTISPPVPALIVATSGSGQSAPVNTQFPSQLVATVKDASNVPVSGVFVTFTAPASGPSITFSTGGNTATITTNAAGIATAPPMTANGSTGQYTVTASVTGLAPASFTLNNTGVSLPAITVANTNIGQNLQGTVTVAIPAAAPTGGLQITLTSGDPNRLLIGGHASGKVTIVEGLTQITVAVEALASTGSTTLTASAPGYADGTGTITMTPSGFVLAGPNDVGASFQTFQSLSTTLTVYSARLDASGKYVEKQPLRASFGSTVTVNVSSTSAGTVTPSSVTFNPGDGSATTSFRAVNTGSATITVQTPSGFSALTDGSNAVTATILQSGLIVPSSVTVGQNLETTMNVGLNGIVGSSGSVFTITSDDPSKLKFSTSPTGAGAGSITINLPANAHGTPDFYVQGFGSSGTVGYTAQATGFGGPVAGSVTLTPSGVVFTNAFGGPPNPILAAAGGSPVTITVYSARLDSSGNWVETQALAGGLSATVNVTNTGNASVGTINPTQVTIAGGSSSATTQFQPNSAGTTNLSVSVPAAPAGFSTPSSTYNTLPVTVSTSKIVLTQDQAAIGKDLEIPASFVLSQPAPSGGLTVTLTSSDASLLRFGVNATDAGQGTLQITVPAGNTVANFYLQGLGSSGTVTYKASAVGYADGNATIILTPSGVVLSDAVTGFPFLSVASGSTVTMSVNMAQLNPADNTFQATQQLRGGLTLNVTVNTGNSAVATVDSPVTIAGGADPTTITTLVHGVGPGTTSVTVTQPPGYVAATNGIFAFKPMPSINVSVN